MGGIQGVALGGKGGKEKGRVEICNGALARRAIPSELLLLNSKGDH